jgi:hypothetical protein
MSLRAHTYGLALSARSSTRNHIYYSTSRDNGVSWTTALPLSLPNPDAKTAALQLVTHDGRCADGPLIMAFNDHSLALCDRCRTKLKLAVSTDSGDTWCVSVSCTSLPLSCAYFRKLMDQFDCTRIKYSSKTVNGRCL